MSKSSAPRMDERHREVGRLLAKAGRVLFITGAGVSAESGIPTFRGTTAAYADGMTEDGIRFEEALSGSTLRRDPKLSWKYFFLLEHSLRGKKPNAAHLAMAQLESTKRSVCIATQNIDGLHQAAGSRLVLELHGNLRRLICTECDYRQYHETFQELPPLPLCPECHAVLRPDAVLYEEQLPQEVLERFDVEQIKGFDLAFSVGTTSLFYYVTQPLIAAARAGVPVVEINPQETPVSDLATFRFTEPAGQTMRSLFSACAPAL